MSDIFHDSIALLSRTPAVLNSLLRDAPDTFALRNEGEGTWSACEVVAHLIHGERTDWIPRARVILQFGETRPFDAFDMSGHVRESEGKSLNELLDEFTRVRAHNVEQLRALNLRPDDLQKRGSHPSLGRVTMSQLLATWAAHDLTHIHQLSRVMAHQYRESVGPWVSSLGVMHCKKV